MKTAKVREPERRPLPPSEHARKAVLARWESVKEEREEWLRPFYQLPINSAMAYLEDLRKICEDASRIMNQRIGDNKLAMRCAGPHCGIDLSGTNPNGRPKWIAKKDVRDPNHPEIIHSLYFCCELHHNEYVRMSQGSMGTTGQ